MSENANFEHFLVRDNAFGAKCRAKFDKNNISDYTFVCLFFHVA